MSNLKRTFSKRLSRTIMLLAIPLFVLLLSAFYRHANYLLHKEAMERSVAILSTTEQLVENYLSAIETAARSNTWMIEEHFSPDSLQVVSRRVVSLNRSVLSCSISTEPDVFPEYGSSFSVYSVNDGDTVITVTEPEFEYFEKNWYKKPMQLGRPCWINPFSDFNAGTINHHDAVGSYCIPLRPKGSRIMGVISVDFSFQKLRETVLATHHPYPSSYYMLLGPSGGYLVHPQTNLLFKNTIFSVNDSVEHPDIIALGRDMTAGHSGTAHVNLDGVLCHVCYMPVADTGWSLALVCQDDDVLVDYNHLTIVMLVIVVVGILLIWWLTRKVVQHNIGPVNELMEATKQVAEGNYEKVIPPSDHKDVVGKLQNAFRSMQLALISHEESARQAAEEVERENAELEQTLPLAKEVSKRREIFIRNVSHQISNPLNVINGLTNVMKANLSSRNKKGLESSEMNSIASTMRHHARLLLRSTMMLYDSSDVGAANASRYDKNDIVACNKEAREAISYTLGYCYDAEIRFETEVPDELTVKTNRRFLMHSIQELLVNAAKFSDGQHITLRVTQTETKVRFTIEDVGPGLPEDGEHLIFVPFAKIDDLSEGLGLGLPLCKSHAIGLGGDLIFDESYSQGCRVIFEIPK